MQSPVVSTFISFPGVRPVYRRSFELLLKSSISDGRKKEPSKNSITVFHMLNGCRKKKLNMVLYIEKD